MNQRPKIDVVRLVVFPDRLLEVIFVRLPPLELVVVLNIFPDRDVELIDDRVPRALVVVLNNVLPDFRTVDVTVLAGLLPTCEVVVRVEPFRLVIDTRFVSLPPFQVDVNVVPPLLMRVVCL